MSVNDKDIQALIRDSVDHTTDLLVFLNSLTQDPTTAVASLMLANAAFAKSMGMTQQDFLQGAAAAFNSLEEGTQHATH